jgi:hypothetical protein
MVTEIRASWLRFFHAVNNAQSAAEPASAAARDDTALTRRLVTMTVTPPRVLHRNRCY